MGVISSDLLMRWPEWRDATVRPLRGNHASLKYFLVHETSFLPARFAIFAYLNSGTDTQGLFAIGVTHRFQGNGTDCTASVRLGAGAIFAPESCLYQPAQI